jgi:hypothetical protein
MHERLPDEFVRQVLSGVLTKYLLRGINASAPSIERHLPAAIQ